MFKNRHKKGIRSHPIPAGLAKLLQGLVGLGISKHLGTTAADFDGCNSFQLVATRCNSLQLVVSVFDNSFHSFLNFTNSETCWNLKPLSAPSLCCRHLLDEHRNNSKQTAKHVMTCLASDGSMLATVVCCQNGLKSPERTGLTEKFLPKKGHLRNVLNVLSSIKFYQVPSSATTFLHLTFPSSAFSVCLSASLCPWALHDPSH